MQLKTVLLLLVVVLLFGCGSKKTVVPATKNISMKRIIEKHKEAAPDFKTLRARLRAGYATREESQSITVSMRMEKDKIIWLSAKLAGIIPLAKVLITPQEVNYYEKINKTYFSGDFRMLSQWLGTPLDFEKVQNLLTGQTIYRLNNDEYRLEENDNGFQFQSEEEVFLAKLFLLNPKTYKTDAQQLVRETEHQSVTVTYPEYQNVGEFYFPKKISILANQAGESTKIDIEYRSLEFDAPVSFPFSIPSGYKEITIE